uniref:hypothetical protein n=1 Tax=Lactococcus garvieae TaxID=1363 RepID=UPI00255021D6
NQYIACLKINKKTAMNSKVIYVTLNTYYIISKDRRNFYKKSKKKISATLLILSSIAGLGESNIYANTTIPNSDTVVHKKNVLKPLQIIYESGVEATQATFDTSTNEIVYKTSIRPTSPGGFEIVLGFLYEAKSQQSLNLLSVASVEERYDTYTITFRYKLSEDERKSDNLYNVKITDISAWGGSDIKGLAIFGLPN